MSLQDFANFLVKVGTESSGWWGPHGSVAFTGRNAKTAHGMLTSSGYEYKGQVGEEHLYSKSGAQDVGIPVQGDGVRIGSQRYTGDPSKALSHQVGLRNPDPKKNPTPKEEKPASNLQDRITADFFDPRKNPGNFQRGGR